MKQLVFVYNANSGWHNSVVDSLHKVLSPKTYDCNLCSVTFGVFSEKEVWRKFREEMSVKMVFLHKNEFVEAYKVQEKYKFPIIFKEENGVIEVFLKTEKINTLKTPQELINLIKSTIK